MQCQINVTIDVNLENSFRLRTFPVLVSNNYPRISGKMSVTIEDKALIINNELINNRFFER
jgi:hypothetical protein